jgi:hypothetical protein
MALNLKGAYNMRGDGQNQLKISAPHPTTELISLLAALISLESPFKGSNSGAAARIHVSLDISGIPHIFQPKILPIFLLYGLFVFMLTSTSENIISCNTISRMAILEHLHTYICSLPKMKYLSSMCL